MNVFYTPGLTSGLYTLSEEESKHCIRVLRLTANDTIYLSDGKGNLHTAKITDASLKKCTVEIIETKKEFGKRNFHLHIAIAPTKSPDRFEWFVEKATEIGIDEITPLICRHSERRTVNHDRLEKIIISALKQSMSAYCPKLNGAVSFNEFFTKEQLGQKFIAHCSDSPKENLGNIYKSGNDTTLLIGPEGDFSNEEITLALENNYREISLGNSRLRTETAGMVACHTINLMNML